MNKFKNANGFTLIEMIIVLVIMAVIVSIAVPIIFIIKEKAKLNSYKRSIDSYGHALELSLSNYLIDHGSFPNDLTNLKVEYSGHNVQCNVMQVKENGGIYLSECSVNNILVEDSKNSDGYYHYGRKDLSNEDYVDLYGKRLEESLDKYYIKNKQIPSNYNELSINRLGKNVLCDVILKGDRKVYLTKCSVNNIKVRDENSSDGWYHYGYDFSDKQYVDLYGDALKKSLKSYYVTNNSLPEDYRTLKVKNVGKNVDCEVTVNYDATIYLTKCKVNGNYVFEDENTDKYYEYGETVYRLYEKKDEVTYNGINFYVVKKSGRLDNKVTLLKKSPLTVQEVSDYGEGHINNYTNSSIGTVYNYNGYGGIVFYSSATCGYVNESRNSTGCNIYYDESDVKYIVDNWTNDKIGFDKLETDTYGYKARLIKEDEYSQFGKYDDQYYYWAIPTTEGGSYAFYARQYYSSLNNIQASYSSFYAVRPVITINKNYLE